MPEEDLTVFAAGAVGLLTFGDVLGFEVFAVGVFAVFGLGVATDFAALVGGTVLFASVLSGSEPASEAGEAPQVPAFGS